MKPQFPSIQWRWRTDGLVLGLAVTLALVLRVINLGSDGLWADECHTAVWGHMDSAWIFEAAAVDTQAPLYFIVNGWLIKLMGNTEWQVRFLSAAAGIASIVAVFWFGSRFLSRSVGRASAVFLAVSPMAVHYSREARCYSMLMLLTVLLMTAVVMGTKKPSLRNALAISACSLTVLYTHNTGVFLVVGAAISAMAVHPRRDVIRMWLAVGALVGLGYSPWLPHVLMQVGEVSDSLTWVAERWSGEYPWQVIRSLAAYSPGSLPPVRNQVSDFPTQAWVGLAFCVGLVVAGWFHRKRLTRPDCLSMLATAIAVPLAAMFCFSWWTHNSIYVVGRVDSPLLPLFALLVCSGIEGIRPAVRPLVIAVVVGLAIYPLEVEIAVDTRSQERSIAALIQERRSPEEVLITTTFYSCMVKYTGARYGEDLFVFPSSVSDRLEWPDWTGSGKGDLTRDAEAVLESALLASRERGAERIWLLVGGNEGGFNLAEVMDRKLTRRDTLELGYQMSEIRSYLVPAEYIAQ